MRLGFWVIMLVALVLIVVGIEFANALTERQDVKNVTGLKLITNIALNPYNL